MTKWAYQENEDSSAVFMQGIHLSPAQKREDDGGVGGALRTLSMEVGQTFCVGCATITGA
jgi:hypothetical protein